MIRHLARVRHVHRARNSRDRGADLPRLGHPQVHEIPWQIGKCEKSGRSEDLGQSQRGQRPKTTLRPAGLQRLKDEHVFLLSRERPRSGGGRRVGCQ